LTFPISTEIGFSNLRFYWHLYRRWGKFC